MRVLVIKEDHPKLFRLSLMDQVHQDEVESHLVLDPLTSRDQETPNLFEGEERLLSITELSEIELQALLPFEFTQGLDRGLSLGQRSRSLRPTHLYIVLPSLDIMAQENRWLCPT